MRISIEPARFRRMLENVLLYHGGVELDSNIGIFTPKKVEFRDMSLDVISVYAAYAKKFFLDYEEVDEEVPLSKSLLEQMRQGFSSDKQITVRTEANKVHLEGAKEHYDETLIEATVADIPIEFTVDKTLGLVPKNLNADIQVLVKANELTGLPKAENYLFHCDGDKLSVVIEDVGKYTREITPVKSVTMKEWEIKFDAGYFMKVASQFSGDVWLTLRPDAAVLSQKLKDSMLTYMISSV